MKTSLPVGTWVWTRHRNEREYGRVVQYAEEDGSLSVGVELGRLPKTGTPVQKCVWKRVNGEGVLEPRGKPQPYSTATDRCREFPTQFRYPK